MVDLDTLTDLVSIASGTDEVTYVIAGDLPTLIWSANLANLEIHTPMWRAPHRDQPDALTRAVASFIREHRTLKTGDPR